MMGAFLSTLRALDRDGQGVLREVLRRAAAKHGEGGGRHPLFFEHVRHIVPENLGV